MMRTTMKHPERAHPATGLFRIKFTIAPVRIIIAFVNIVLKHNGVSIVFFVVNK